MSLKKLHVSAPEAVSRTNAVGGSLKLGVVYKDNSLQIMVMHAKDLVSSLISIGGEFIKKLTNTIENENYFVPISLKNIGTKFMSRILRH